MKITVVGTGYVGLVSAVCFAHWGHTVTCVEADQKKLSVLKTGRSPIFEKDVEEFMRRYVKQLSFTDNCRDACKEAEAVFICVGTPEREDGFANLKQVFAIAGEIADSVFLQGQKGAAHRGGLQPRVFVPGDGGARLSVRAAGGHRGGKGARRQGAPKHLLRVFGKADCDRPADGRNDQIRFQ